MSNIIEAASGEQSETDSSSGPGSYPTGGFSIRSDLGRVDEAAVEADSHDYDAHVASISDNNAIVVEVSNSDVGSETTGGTDLSGVTFTHSAHRL